MKLPFFVAAIIVIAIFYSSGISAGWLVACGGLLLAIVAASSIASEHRSFWTTGDKSGSLRFTGLDDSP